VIALAPGDLLLTRSEGRAGFMIRLGAALRNKPNLVNHVAIVHHIDKTGTMWVVEGRPSGVGWRDAKDYLNDPHTVCNATQPITPGQGAQVAKGAAAMLGTDYDWGAIVADAAAAFGLDHVWELRWGKAGTVPGQVVCSSLAAYLYQQAGLAHPSGEREVDPADWLALWLEKSWASRP
jgi:hypothetical protein